MKCWFQHYWSLKRARDENHFISHATIAIVPNPVIVSMLYALNNAIDAATSSARVRDLSTPPTVHNGKQLDPPITDFFHTKLIHNCLDLTHAEHYLSIIPKLSTIQSNHSTKKSLLLHPKILLVQQQSKKPLQSYCVGVSCRCCCIHCFSVKITNLQNSPKNTSVGCYAIKGCSSSFL